MARLADVLERIGSNRLILRERTKRLLYLSFKSRIRRRYSNTASAHVLCQLAAQRKVCRVDVVDALQRGVQMSGTLADVAQSRNGIFRHLALHLETPTLN